MKRILITTATLFTTLTIYGQHLLFFGENSYPCTETFTLKTNSSDQNDLEMLFAKADTNAIFAVKIKVKDEIFCGKFIIYLDDGSVISCADSESYDYVDGIAIALYSLTDEQLNKMSTSNINSVRFALRSVNSQPSYIGDKFTASNIVDSATTSGTRKTDVPSLLTKFYK